MNPETETPQDWYFTFAANHLHPFTGEALGRFYVVINATERDAIRAVRDVFGDQWAHYYVSPRQAGVEEYDLQHLPLPVESFGEQVDGHLRRLEDDRYAASPALSTPAEERVEEQSGGAAALRADVVTSDAGHFHLTDDQLDALRALLGLVHYDDLAMSWLALLPIEFRSRGEQQ